MYKEYTSKVETSREKFEEPEQIVGRVIKSNQVWRDANLIPAIAPEPKNLSSVMSANGDKIKSGVVLTFRDGETVHGLISYYSKLKLNKIDGTLNCFNRPQLVNIILPEMVAPTSKHPVDFDSSDGKNDISIDMSTESKILNNVGKSYAPTFFIKEKDSEELHPLAYGLGKPIFNIAAGTVYFVDEDFAIEHANDEFYISFYNYIGRMGTSIGAGLDNPDLPFRDSIKHFKNENNNKQTATLKVRGDIKNTNYILPPEDGRPDEHDTTNVKEKSGKWYNKNGESDTGVILLQETLEDTLWCQSTHISGGSWTSNGVYKY